MAQARVKQPCGLYDNVQSDMCIDMRQSSDNLIRLFRDSGRVFEHVAGKRWYCLDRNFLTVHGTRLLCVFTHPFLHAYTHAYTHVKKCVCTHVHWSIVSHCATHAYCVPAHMAIHMSTQVSVHMSVCMSIDPDVQADAVLVHRHRDTRNDQRMYPGHAAEA